MNLKITKEMKEIKATIVAFFVLGRLPERQSSDSYRGELTFKSIVLLQQE